MKVASCKNKSRLLQQWVVKEIINMFPWLSKDDVRSTPMGVTGPDVQLSTRGKLTFPYEVECKNREDIKGIYNMYEQACSHGKLEPVVFIKSNRKKPLVIVDAKHFITLTDDVEDRDK